MNRIRTALALRLPRQPAPGLRPRLRERPSGARGARAARQHRRAPRNSDGTHRRQDARARARRARQRRKRHEPSPRSRRGRRPRRARRACFKPPEIVMVDRATALEQQASGSFDDLERKLDRAGIEPRPVPLTPEQLEALGIRPAPLVDESDLTDADRLDGLLAQHCVGEGKDGLIVDTRDACKGAADAEEVQTLLERVNRARRQLWRWMHEQRTDVSGGGAAARVAREPRAERGLRRMDRRERREVARKVVLKPRALAAAGLALAASLRRRARVGRQRGRRRSPEAPASDRGRGRRSARPARARRQDALLRVEPRHDQPALRPEHGRRPRAAALRRRRGRHLAAGEPGRAVTPLHLVPRERLGAALRPSTAGGGRAQVPRRTRPPPCRPSGSTTIGSRSSAASRSRGTCASWR